MKLFLENYKDDYTEGLPKFGINWFYYPGARPEVMVKANKYRERMSFPKVLDDGSYFRFHINFGRRVFGFELQIRPRVLGDVETEPHD